MKHWLKIALVFLALPATRSQAGVLVFKDDFIGRIDPGWSWIREHREAWRTTAKGLEVRMEPGNMWGGANNARNVLVRTVPDPAETPLVLSVQVENRPT
jgi:hypothetical protein